MEKVTGTSILKGIAIGRILFYQKRKQQIKPVKVTDIRTEKRRYEEARKTAVLQLKELQKKAEKEVGRTDAGVFEAHAVMVVDEDYADSVLNIIETQQVNAEFAVAVTGDDFFKMFSGMDDDFFRARAADVKDVSERLIDILSGIENAGNMVNEPVIIVADELSPSETIQMDKGKLLGFVTRQGSANSHTAILAKTMDIPALIGVDIKKEWNGKTAIIDGYSGNLYIEPDKETYNQMRTRLEEDQKAKALLRKLKGKEDVTLDGKKIKLYANIGSVSDVAGVLANDAAGIGLFRSEFLYLEAKDYPSEESQFQAYKAVAENMAGKEVIIRTLDIGADKQADYFQLEREENPAMGYRAIRICLEQPDIFKTQLRALLRASAFGNISIMYPMIISVEEVRKIKGIVESVKAELDAQGIPYGEFEQGIMIETPAAVMISDLLAEEVDFFSIGTNDLTQYTLAIDRQNRKLDGIYDSHHPAVLRMIQMTVENGHKHGCKVGICGELAADPALTRTFLKMGIDELSVPPSLVLPIRKNIREMELGEGTVTVMKKL